MLVAMYIIGLLYMIFLLKLFKSQEKKTAQENLSKSEFLELY